jgi:hypothetical protein
LLDSMGLKANGVLRVRECVLLREMGRVFLKCVEWGVCGENEVRASERNVLWVPMITLRRYRAKTDDILDC